MKQSLTSVYNFSEIAAWVLVTFVCTKNIILSIVPPSEPIYTYRNFFFLNELLQAGFSCVISLKHWCGENTLSPIFLILRLIDSWKWNLQSLVLFETCSPWTSCSLLRLLPAMPVHHPIRLNHKNVLFSSLKQLLKIFQNSSMCLESSCLHSNVANDTCIFKSGW